MNESEEVAWWSCNRLTEVQNLLLLCINYDGNLAVHSPRALAVYYCGEST